MLKPLTLVQRNIESHVTATEGILRSALGVGSDLRLEADWDQDPVGISLAGPICEAVRRNRGGVSQVAPLLRLTDGMWAWLGFQEDWGFQQKVAGTRALTFRSLSMTIHFGWKDDLIKPQIFRAEWAGYAPWAGKDPSFQGKNAGHPHWQFDVLESLATEGHEELAKDLLQLLRDDDGEPDDGQVKEFAPVADTGVVADIIRAQKLSRIHFASAAPWWKPAPQGDHAHAPANVQQAQQWVSRTLTYVKEELARLQA